MKLYPYQPVIEQDYGQYDYRKFKPHWKDRKKYVLADTGIMQESCILIDINNSRCAHFVFRDYGVNEIRAINFNIVIQTPKEEIWLPQCTVQISYTDDNAFYIRLKKIMYAEYSSITLHVNWIDYHSAHRSIIDETFIKMSTSQRKVFSEIQEARSKYSVSAQKTSLSKNRFLPEIENSAWTFFAPLKTQLIPLYTLLNDLYVYSAQIPPIHEVCQTAKERITIPIRCTFDANFYSILHFIQSYSPTKQSFENGLPIYHVAIDKVQTELIMLIYYLNFGYSPYYPNATLSELEEFLYSVHPAMKLKKALDLLNYQYNGTAIVEQADIVISAKRTLSDYFQSLDTLGKEAYSILLEHQQIHGRWIREYRLYSLIKILFPDAIYQYRDEWLHNQSLDIFIPSRKLAIEVQGEQHYKPVAFFGGDDAFAYRKQLDELKYEKCKNHGIELLEWPYYRTIHMDTIQCILATYFPERDYFQNRIRLFSETLSLQTMGELLFRR